MTTKTTRTLELSDTNIRGIFICFSNMVLTEDMMTATDPIKSFTAMGSLLMDFAEQVGITKDNVQDSPYRDEFNGCIDAMALFRDTHKIEEAAMEAGW